MHRDRVSLSLPLAGVSARLDLFQLLLRVIGDLLLLLLQLVLGALPTIDLEAVYLGHVGGRGGLGEEIGVDHHEYIGEGAAEVGAVDVVALLLRHIDLLAARTEYLHPGSSDLLAHSNR